MGNSNLPLTSIIIATYNRRNLISDTIESALAISSYPVEVIVVDDGSTDDTSEVIKKYKNRIQYYSISHSGCAAARNFGIREAKGQYVIFLDSDDLLDPLKLVKEIPILEKDKKTVFVYSPYTLFYDGASHRSKLILPVEVGSSKIPLSFAFFMIPRIHISTIIFRKDCFEKRLFDESLRYHEDGDLIQRLLIQFCVAYSDYPSLKVRVHRGMKSQNRVEIYKAMLKSHEKIASAYPDFIAQLGNLYEKRYLELCYRLGRSYLFQGDLINAKGWMKKASRAESSLRWKARTYFSILCLPKFVSQPLLKSARKI